MKPPKLIQPTKYPVTVSFALAACAVSVAWWCKYDISLLAMDFRYFSSQPWRMLTSALPHVNLMHLGFNVYWLWVFGTFVERRYGKLRTLGIYLLFAGGSALAEYTLFQGGVGLSGVGYGLFGLLWVLSRNDPECREAMDAETVRLFVVWFFICIATTVAGVMPVANAAHGAGAGMGLLLGNALSGPPSRRRAAGVASVVLLVALLGAAVFARPWLNLSGQMALEYWYKGAEADLNGNQREAIDYYRKSLAINEKNDDVWVNLGYALEQTRNSDEAHGAFQRAFNLNPSLRNRVELGRFKLRLAYQRQIAQKLDEAIALYQQGLELEGADSIGWYNLGLCYEALGRKAEALAAVKKAADLDPNAEYKAKLEQLQSAGAARIDGENRK